MNDLFHINQLFDCIHCKLRIHYFISLRPNELCIEWPIDGVETAPRALLLRI